VSDLIAEHAELDALVAGIGEASWKSVTPAEGWTIADSIGHLDFFDERARLALVDPEAFAADRESPDPNYSLTGVISAANSWPPHRRPIRRLGFRGTDRRCHCVRS